MQGGVKAAAEPVTSGEGEAIAFIGLLEFHRLRQDPVKEVSFFQLNRGRFDNIMDALQPIMLCLSILSKLGLLY